MMEIYSAITGICLLAFPSDFNGVHAPIKANDGVHDAAGILRDLFEGKEEHGTTRIPSGTYRIDNSRGPLLVYSAAGSFVFDRKTLLVCDSLQFGCLQFERAHSLTLRGLTATYLPPRTARNGAQLLAVNHSSGVRVLNTTLYNGNSSGLHMGDCRGCSVTNLHVHDLLANGFFGSNLQHFVISHVRGERVGDAVFEVSRYDSVSGVCDDIVARDITALDSVGGILINACTHVSVSHFRIVNLSRGSGVKITQDRATTSKGYPDDIDISDGMINCVALHGIDIGLAPTGRIVDIAQISVRDVSILDTLLDGVNIMPQNAAAKVFLNRIVVARSKRLSFRFNGQEVVANNLLAIAPSYPALYIGTGSVFIGRLFLASTAHITPLSVPDLLLSPGRTSPAISQLYFLLPNSGVERRPGLGSMTQSKATYSCYGSPEGLDRPFLNLERQATRGLKMTVPMANRVVISSGMISIAFGCGS